MPIYEYYCGTCDKTSEEFFRMAERPEQCPCECGGMKEFRISAPSGQCDDIVNVPWIREFAETRPEARFKKKTIETRMEYKKYLNEKGLRPCSGPNLSEV